MYEHLQHFIPIIQKLFYTFFYHRTEKEKELMKYQAEEAKAAMDNLARDKVK